VPDFQTAASSRPYYLPVTRERPNLSPIEAADVARAAVLRIVRAGAFVVFVTVIVLSMLSAGPGSTGSRITLVQSWPLILGVGLGLGGVVVLIDLFTTTKKIGLLVSVFLGLLAAMLATAAVAYLIDVLALLYDINSPTMISLTKVLVGIGLTYLCISTVLQTQDDFRLVIPYVEFAKQVRGPRPLALDSSALIDARIADLCNTGIIQVPLVIPRFVIAELQLLADSSDKLKRGRGRRGLEVISRLQRAGIDLSIDETTVPGKAVDQMLVELARMMPATIVTADVGLNRVAAIHGVKVLNLNDVANALKPSLIPGEQLSLRLQKAGEQPGQAVGYLDDGTMVVAENGGQEIGNQVTLVVTSTLQTSAGRLIFGRVHEESSLASSSSPSSSTTSSGTGVPPVSTTTTAPSFLPDPPSPALAGSPSHQSSDIPHPTSQPRSPFPPKPAGRPNPARNPRR
jgi:uncharacterized protein YacL